MTQDTQVPGFRHLTPEARAAVTARAVAAAVQVAKQHGIAVEAPVVLAERYAVRVHLRPAPLVARVSTFTALLRPPIESWLARELAVTSFLHRLGAPVVPPSPLLPSGPYLRDGFAISFWQFVAPLSDEPAPAEVAGAMLAELHQALRGYHEALPFLAPPFNDIPRGLERLEQIGTVLSPDEVSMLRRLADRLLPAAQQASREVQPLHGDAHGYNLIRSPSGLLWNDFEDVCMGPIAWDLSTLSDPEDRMLQAYPGAPAPAELEHYRRLRLLHGAVWVFALTPELDEWTVQARGMLDMLRTFA
jgi:hypothetical protein